MSECSIECQAVKDAAASMDVDELEAELEASGRFSDPRAVAEFLKAGETGVEDEPLPEEPVEEEEPPA